MDERQWNLIDDLLSEFLSAKNDDGWFFIGPETREALRTMFQENERLREQLMKASEYIQRAKSQVPGIVSGEPLDEAIGERWPWGIHDIG